MSGSLLLFFCRFVVCYEGGGLWSDTFRIRGVQQYIACRRGGIAYWADMLILIHNQSVNVDVGQDTRF